MYKNNVLKFSIAKKVTLAVHVYFNGKIPLKSKGNWYSYLFEMTVGFLIQSCTKYMY